MAVVKDLERLGSGDGGVRGTRPKIEDCGELPE
jgi:hypothetical protein